MIQVKNLFKILKKNKINFFTGVPDSILKNFSSHLEKLKNNQHVIASNEGSAASIRVGHYLSTKKFLVFIFKTLDWAMQLILLFP